jgi:hypothetical protein
MNEYRHSYLTDRAISAADITLYPSLQWLKRALAQSQMLDKTQQVVLVIVAIAVAKYRDFCPSRNRIWYRRLLFAIYSNGMIT